MDLATIGYFSKTHGLKGQLLLKPYRDFDLSLVKTVFIEERGSKAPYFVSAASDAAHGILFLLEGISSVEQAKPFLKKEVLADAASLIADESADDLEGYTVIEDQLGELGKVVSVSDNGAQELLHLNYKGNEIMLPVVDDFIQEIDEQQKIIRYRAPEGLIDLFSSDPDS